MREASLSLKIREAGPGDALRIAALHTASWRHAYRGMLSAEYLDGDLLSARESVWVDRLTNPKPTQHVVLAEIDNQLAGFACAFGSEDPELGTLLDNLHVSAEFQRQGIGTELMLKIVVWCKEVAPAESLHLWVLEANTRARKFYEGLGGQQVRAEIWPSPDGGALPSICYAWKDPRALEETLNLLVRLGVSTPSGSGGSNTPHRSR